MVSKEYFPTKTIDNTSLDSAVYVLRTFEIKDSIKYILPIYKINSSGDSILLQPKPQLVLIDQLTKKNTYDYRLKELVLFNKIQPQVNYFYYFVIGTVIFIATSLIFFFFRKAIVKRIKLYTISKSFYSFVKNFEKLEKDFIKTQQLPIMENALSLWKIYLTKLDDTPINTYTTTEIISLFRDAELADGLQIIDKSIYRGMISGEPEKALAILRKFSLQRYQQIKIKIFNER